MKRITAIDFKNEVKVDPSWAAKLTKPVEITGSCNMRGSGITHLSPFLRFLGRDRKGNCASFANCHALKVAEGTFAGTADFQGSGIEEIGKLIIKRNNRNGCDSFH